MLTTDPNRFYVYLYTDPSNNTAFYVGKGSNKRAYDHLYPGCKSLCADKVRELRANGLEPIITFLCKDVDAELAHLCEQMAVEKFGRLCLNDGTLLNKGAGGVSNTGWVGPKEYRDRLSAVRKGSKRSEATKAAMSIAQTTSTAKFRRPCTVDGITIYPSHSALIAALGQGKNGRYHPDFRFV